MLLTTVLIMLNSCSLEEHIEDSPTPATITSESDVDAVIQGMYSRYNDSGMFKFLGFIMITICADDIFSNSGSEYGLYAERTYTSGSTNPMWSNMYATIENANNLIEVLDKLELSPAFEKRAYGEAYFNRAFAYYYLVRLYGGVPLRTTATHIDSDFYLPRTSIDETYAQIIKDFKAASERLPASVVAGELGRATKGAAQGFLAQALLTYGNQLSLAGKSGTAQYTEAGLYADSVIISKQYALTPDYKDLFDINKETDAYKEVIFGIRFTTDPQARAQPAAGSEYAQSFGAGNTWGVSAGGANGNNAYRGAHWFADYYRSGDYLTGTDPRNNDNIDYRNLVAFHQRSHNNANKFFAVYPNVPGSTVPGSTGDGTINDPIIAKYQDPGGKDARNNGNDFFVLRYAEVLLIKAEAENELNGQTKVATDAFNQVRYRARTVNSIPNARPVPADLLPNTLTKDQFRMKIFDERGIEFLAEGLRWFDLVRMRSPLNPKQTMYEYQFKVVLADPKKFPPKLPTGYNAASQQYTPTPANAVKPEILNVGPNVTNLNGVTGPKFILFPVPSQELLQNKNFGPQNTGW
ncbi:MAG: hypothetical protein K0S09_864 [Sphingobacteriaceae bacterium]|nr:hypothetical protein [Sphingobacteriaceae bacterium]